MPGAAMNWIPAQFEARCQVTASVLGHEHYQQRDIRVLNLVVLWLDGGLHHDPDQRHADIAIRERELDGAKPAN